MRDAPALLSTAVRLFDRSTGISALALRHPGGGRRGALVYHDAPSVAATTPVLAAVAAALSEDKPPGHAFSLIETSMPEHRSERFVYAQLAVRRGELDRLEARHARILAADAVAAACGISLQELQRLEALITALHRPRRCAFAAVGQTLPSGGRRRAAPPAEAA